VRLFGRSQADIGDLLLRLYYASDIHGTEVLWKKFLNASKVYKAKVLVMGGDITGKMVIPIVRAEDGVWTAQLFGRKERMQTEAEVEKLERRIRGNGMYPYRTTAGEVSGIAALPEEEQERWFEGVMLEAFRGWLELADERLMGTDIRCFVMPGNDDPDSLEGVIRTAERVESCDEKVVQFDGYSMLSLGYSNRTPWNSPRELDEDALYTRIVALADQIEDQTRAVWNIHVPPHDSQLDTAAELDEDFNMVLIGKQPHLIPVGSSAVRDAIERYQPLVALHGHIHESPGATRIGRTLCVNPGSDYHTGRIAGCIVNLRGDRVNHQFVTG
jgi:Icc-related predicted phosphoesterase